MTKTISARFNIRLSVTDDNGYKWFFRDGRIHCEGDYSEGGGYLCEDLEDGINVLIKYGYITEEDECTL